MFRRLRHTCSNLDESTLMRDDYLAKARLTIDDPMILINLVSQRVKQLRRGSRPLVESLEKLALEDIALREISEGKISYVLGKSDDEIRDNKLAAL